MKRIRELQKQATRQRIIAAASRLFADKGIHGTTTEEVARLAGVAHGTVFAHFRTQEALLTAVIEEFGTAVAGRLHELASRSRGVGAVLRAHLTGLSESEGLYRRLVTEGFRLPARARASLVMVQSAISHHVSEAAEHAMEAGEIRRMPVALLFNTWIGLLHLYLANAELFAPEGGVLERRGSELYRHFLMLIRVEKPRTGKEDLQWKD